MSEEKKKTLKEYQNFILEEAKETAFEFSQGTVKVLWAQFY